MKFKLFILAIFAISFVLVLSSCSKSPRDKILNVYEKVIDWMNSENFESEIQAMIDKDPNNINENFQKKLNDFILAGGFKDRDEFDSIHITVMNDPEIKELDKKINNLYSEKYFPLIRKQREKMQEELKKQMQNQQQETPADSTAKQ